MKKLFLYSLITVFSCLQTVAQQLVTDSIAQVQKDSSESARFWKEREIYWKQYNDSVKESQKEDINRYKLYKTQNTWTFIKLDTQTGKTWQVQFSVQGSSYRYQVVLDKTSKLSSSDLVISGRFELYPTDNMYNFILLDRINGRCWQVQWSQDVENRLIFKID